MFLKNLEIDTSQNTNLIYKYPKEIINNETKLNPDFEITLQRLLELKNINIDEFNDDEISTPSDYAFSVSINLLSKLYQDLGDAFPRGFAILDSRGGINLIWRNQEFNKEVKVKIAVNNQLQSYVYYYQSDNSKLVNITENTVTNYVHNLLLWLSNNNSINSL